MPSFRRVIRHLFGGGWATDLGPSALGVVPTEQGLVVVPYLVDAEDCLLELDGGPHKAPGTTKLNSGALESGATVKGLTDLWLQGTSGTPAQHRVIHVGTKIYKDDADGSFAQLKSGLEDDAVPNYATFDDLLIISSSSTVDVPFSWDGTTFQNLAGSPPNFSFSVKHKNYMFAAGVASDPSRLYYSKQLDPEDWTTGDSGSIQIDPDDGDMITGIISHKNELWVFKGPYKGSIHRITGSNDTDWARTTFIEGVGAVWQNSIFRFADDVGFLWSDGSIRSLSATDAFGDFREASLTFPIQTFLTQQLNFGRLKHAVAATDGSGGKVYLTLPIASSTTNNVILALDFRFTPARWTKLPSFAAATASLVLDTGANLRPIIMLGGYDGFVRKWSNSTRTLDGDSALSFKVTLPHLDYGFPHIMKTLAAGSIGVQPKNNGDVTVAWTRDDNAKQTTTVTQAGGSDVLGTVGVNNFTLGTSTLGGASFVDRWFETEEGGEFRSIQYQITNSTNNEDVELHSFTSFIEPGAESTEN